VTRIELSRRLPHTISVTRTGQRKSITIPYRLVVNKSWTRRRGAGNVEIKGAQRVPHQEVIR
jgi:hypothetical protein